jgi:hypothetical protein
MGYNNRTHVREGFADVITDFLQEIALKGRSGITRKGKQQEKDSRNNQQKARI